MFSDGLEGFEEAEGFENGAADGEVIEGYLGYVLASFKPRWNMEG